jgi:hypothetical protein
MVFLLSSTSFALFLFVAVLGLLEFGRRTGQRRAALEAEGARPGLGVVDGAVFGLLGLLIAFSFSGAAARFDHRRALIVEEANAIGTSWLRIDLLPAEVQPPVRDLYRRYLDARIEGFRKIPDFVAAKAALARANALQGEIWSRTLAACQGEAGQRLVVPVLGPLNQMFDIATVRNEILYLHPPGIIFAMIGLLSMIGSMLAGYGMAGSKRRSWLHLIGFAAILSFTVYVILDLETPRAGWIQVDAADRVLIELRASMAPR